MMNGSMSEKSAMNDSRAAELDFDTAMAIANLKEALRARGLSAAEIGEVIENGAVEGGDVENRRNRNNRSRPDFEIGDETGGQPLPLMRPYKAPMDYPVDALGPTLAAAVRGINEVVKCPMALTAGSVLCAASLATMPHADVVHPVTARLIPLSLFLLEIGESGERKSESDKIAMKPVAKYSEELRVEYEAECADFDASYRAWELSKAEIEKKAKGDQARLKNELDRHGPPPQPPLTPSLVVDEPTWEGLVKSLAFGRPAMALATDEGGSFIGGHAMQADAKVRTITGMSKLWDGSVVTRSRSSEKALYLPGRRLATHLMAQFGIAQLLLSDKLASDQGYVARFLISYPESAKGTRFLTLADARAEYPAAVIEYHGKLDRALRHPVQTVIGTRNTLSPRHIRLSEAATVRWVTFSNSVEKMLDKGGELRSISAFANKLNEQAIRLAGVMTLFDDPNAQEIGDEALANAIELTDFYAGELLRLNEMGSIPEDLQLARDLLEWLHGVWGEEKISLAAIYHRGPSKIRNKKTAKLAVTVLVEHNWLIKADGDHHVVDGRVARNAWTVIREAGDGSL